MTGYSLTRRRLFAQLSLLSAGAVLSPRAFAGAPKLETLAEEAVAGGWPPAIGMIEVIGGKLTEPRVFGVRAVGGRDPARPTDHWHIGSNAKSMTATLVARLAEKGVLDWSAPLADMLPDIEMREEYRSVVLADLLSHRAGFARNSAAGLERMPDDDARTPGARRAEYIAAALTEAPIGPVGSGAGAYSNTGFVIAGVIAERAAGLPFEALMREAVFDPLGMSSVDFGGTPEGDIAGHYRGAPVYDVEGDNPDFLRPAGGLHLTLADWGAYVLDQMKGEKGGGRLLTAASYRLLHAPQPGSMNGLGWGLEAAPGGKPMWSHNGSNGRWFGLVAVLPEDERAAMIVANAAGEDVERTVNRLAVRTLGLVEGQP